MQIVRKLKTNMHICATGSKAERVVAHFLHIVVFVLISSQLFGVGWGGLITFIGTSHTHTCSDLSYRVVMWNASVVQNDASIIPDRRRRIHRIDQSRGSSVRCPSR